MRRPEACRLRGFYWVLLLLCVACEPGRDQRLGEIRALQSQERMAGTIEPLRELLASDPEDPELHRLYGRALYSADSASTALWSLRKAAEDPEHSVEDLVFLAQALSETGARAECLEVLESVLAIEPDRRGMLALRARVSLHVEDHAIALDSADRLLVLEDRPQIHLWRARALVGLDRFAEAEGALAAGRELLADSREVAALHLPLCETAVEIAEAGGAEDEIGAIWERCVREAPGAGPVLDAAVTWFDEQGEPERSTTLLREAFERAGSFDFRLRLARRLESEGFPEEAERLLREATESPRFGGPAWMALGDLHRARGDYDEAARALGTALGAQETAPIGLVAQYADDLLQAGEFAEADKVIETIPRPEYALLLRGRALLLQGDPAGASEALEEGIRLWPSNATARLLAGQTAEKLGDFDRAAREYRAAIRAKSSEGEAVFILADLHARQGDDAAAAFALHTRIVSSPSDERAHLELVRLLGIMGAVDAGGEAVEQIRTIPGAEKTAALGAALAAYYFDGPAAAAASIRAEGLDLTLPRYADVRRALVGYLAEAHRVSEALALARADVGAAPDRAELHEIHAIALRAAGRTDEEREALLRAQSLAPESAAVLAALARLDAEAGRTESAIELYDRAAAADSEDPAPGWAAVELLVREAQEPSGPDGVDQRLERLLYEHPHHPRAARELALRLVTRGEDLERAVELARRAVRFGGGAEALETLGLLEVARGKSRRAVRSLLLSLELRPESPSTRYQLARAYLAAGESTRAREALRAALADGDFAEASDARSELARLEEETSDG